MHPKHPLRQNIRIRPEPGLGRMVAVSFLIHLAILALASGVLVPHLKKTDRPVYIVDLVNLPVKDPQAGRPDATPSQPKKKQPEPAAPKPKEDVVKLPPKPKEKTQTVVKPKEQPRPKPEPKPAVTKKDEQNLNNAMEEIRRRQEMQTLKNKLAALTASKDTRKPTVQAPVGMPDGKGSQAGIDASIWLQNFLKESWRLSKYQVGRPDVEATVQIIFNADGRLKNYNFIKESGDSRFDESVKRAILELNNLPEPPKSLAGMKQEVVFNLKDLLQ